MTLLKKHGPWGNISKKDSDLACLWFEQNLPYVTATCWDINLKLYTILFSDRSKSVSFEEKNIDMHGQLNPLLGPAKMFGFIKINKF